MERGKKLRRNDNEELNDNGKEVMTTRGWRLEVRCTSSVSF
jgi:hypothetical protein